MKMNEKYDRNFYLALLIPLAIAVYVFVILPEPPQCDNSPVESVLVPLISNEYGLPLLMGAIFVIPNLHLVRGKV